eukprot:CAMPEP_0194046474 /NCGR_PEP_ID=MMETSP0009_2-20130614/21141_1 /TAXON_ID=210454 /ORGANISM="Grammatophora oceanica, Strain CCMP 410" /LENGTH=508 /DNA_ID=CAMNT_0038691777 /DNA_START=385 /DNA_END=1911 /DNA_ORIENTATION=+
MVRFRRHTSATQPLPDQFESSVALSDDVEDDDAGAPAAGTPTAERRRQRQLRVRRKQSKPGKEDSSPEKKESARNLKKKQIYEDEMDPYDSDPGESYRQHCMQIRGLQTKSCLRVPKLLKNVPDRAAPVAEEVAVQETRSASTAPPSPLSSELEDALNQTPDALEEHGVSTRVRYSLRTSIGDGSVQEPVGPSVMDRRELRPNNTQVNVSYWSDKGGRPYMEDRYSVEDLGSVQVEVSPVAVRSGGDVEVTYGGDKKNLRLKMPLTWFACFDGHGGDKASQYCADWLSSYVRHEDCFPYDLGYAMKKAFTSIDEDFINTGNPDGTTACCVSLVGGRRIVCANAGDSRAIVVRKDGSVVRLSRDHKPGMPDETKRITELGGRVIYWGRWRVEGLLAVSRAIGDASLKPYITSEPEVCEYDVGPDDWFLIISSDGVWDVLDNEEAAHVVIATSCVIQEGELVIDTNRFKWAARKLTEHAKSCGSTDNFSALIVDLQSCSNNKALEGRYKP